MKTGGMCGSMTRDLNADHIPSYILVVMHDY